MTAFSRGLPTILLFLLSALSTLAQKVEFSADMRVSDGAGRAQTLKLFVGNMRARFDLPKEGNNTSGIGSILIDFDHQSIFLLIPQAKLYLQIEGSAGTPFYSGAWMFRPYSVKYPCNDWVSEADRRGITLRCNSGGQDILDGRPTQRWDATTLEGGHGFSLVRSGAEFHREGFADLEIGRAVWVRITKREAAVPAGDPF
jgi:hypothetical protein